MEPVSTSSRPYPPLPGSWPETRPRPDHPRGPTRKVLLDLTRLPAVPFLASPRLAQVRPQRRDLHRDRRRGLLHRRGEHKVRRAA